MDLRPIVDGYSVAPQLTPADMAELASLGVTTVICNRPDAEVPPNLSSDAIRTAAEDAGLHYVHNPVIGLGLAPEAIDAQASAIDGASGHVVAYCASGMRSALMWALAMAGRRPVTEILAIVGDAGYRMDHLAGQIEGIGKVRR
ncbi:MAG: TIGR01244 family sulfur transferase [Pseudomonadota bacterium]